MFSRKSRKMPIIGLTGPSGAGKGEVSECLSKYGIKCVDTDAVYHALLVPPSDCYDELVGYFGKDIVSPSGEIDRKKLSAIVFKPENREYLDMLNKITHKHILLKTLEILAKYEADGAKAGVIDAPLLFESEFYRKCDVNISVIAPFDLRLERIVARDKIPVERAKERLKAQKIDGFYISRSDYTIVNDSDISSLAKQVDEIIALIFGS